MGILERFDGGDIVGAFILFAVLTPWTGISNGTEYFGFSVVAPAFTAGQWTVAMATVGIWVGTIVAYVTNQGMNLDSILKRPLWEKLTAVGTMLAPLIINNIGGLESWMLQSYINGTAVYLLVYAGFIVVGFRRMNDKKRSFMDTVSRVADPS